MRNKDALIGNVSETESNSETSKYVPEDSLESKSDSHGNDEISLFHSLRKSDQNILKTYFLDN